VIISLHVKMTSMPGPCENEASPRTLSATLSLPDHCCLRTQAPPPSLPSPMIKAHPHDRWTREFVGMRGQQEKANEVVERPLTPTSPPSPLTKAQLHDRWTRELVGMKVNELAERALVARRCGRIEPYPDLWAPEGSNRRGIKGAHTRTGVHPAQEAARLQRRLKPNNHLVTLLGSRWGGGRGAPPPRLTCHGIPTGNMGMTGAR
jgi:hypothetical protein